jgi:hypothetical protein
MPTGNCTTICRIPEVNSKACYGCPGKGHEHCQACGADRDTLYQCLGEPVGTVNYRIARAMINNCHECAAAMVFKGREEARKVGVQA